MTIPEQPLDPPEMPEDIRPQFGTFSEQDQYDIIWDFLDEHPEHMNWINEARSQLLDCHQPEDVWNEIAKYIYAKYPDQEWCI